MNNAVNVSNQKIQKASKYKPKRPSGNNLVPRTKNVNGKLVRNSNMNADWKDFEYWSGIGTVLCGNYDGIPVMILALENDKSYGLRKIKALKNGKSTENKNFPLTFNKNNKNNGVMPIYEDFGGAIKSSEMSLEKNALYELHEETAGLINIRDEDNLNMVKKHGFQNFIDFYPDFNDGFGRYRLYFIRLSDELITAIINEELIKKNYLKIIGNVKLYKEIILANERFTKALFENKTVYNNATKEGKRVNRRYNSNSANNESKAERYIRTMRKIPFGRVINENKFADTVKSFLEISDIAVIPIDSMPSGERREMHHPFIPSPTAKIFYYEVPTIFGDNIAMVDRPAKGIYGFDQKGGIDVLYSFNFSSNNVTQGRNGLDVCRTLLSDDRYIINLRGSDPFHEYMDDYHEVPEFGFLDNIISLTDDV